MRKYKLFRVLTGFILLGGVSINLAVTQQASAAGIGYHYYQDSYDINAWNGGPYIKAYAGSNDNDDFLLEQDGGTGYYFITYQHIGSPYYGYCISDSGNSSSSFTAALNNCNNSVPWGANFEQYNCGNNTVAFFNVRWGGWLAAANSNGAQFYLNGSKVCYHYASV